MKKNNKSVKINSKNENVKIESQSNFSTQNNELKTVTNKSQTPQIKPYYVVIGVIIVALLSLLYYFKSFFIVAIVNGQPIWRSTLNNQMAKQYGQQMLDTLITETLIEQQAKNKGIMIDDDKVASETAKIEESVASQGQTLDQILILQGMTRDDLKKQLRLNLMVEQLAGSDASASAEEVTNYIKDNSTTLPKDLTGNKLTEYVANLLASQKRSQIIQSWLVNLKQGAKIQTF